MKITGTKQEIDFITEIIEDNDVECARCPYKDECMKSVLNCGNTILSKTTMSSNSQDTIILMTFWDKLLGHHNFRWFKTKEEMDSYITHNNIMKADIIDQLEITESKKLN